MKTKKKLKKQNLSSTILLQASPHPFGVGFGDAMILDISDNNYIYKIEEGEELFVQIIGYEGLYEISNYGLIKALRKERINGRNTLRIYPEKILKCSISPQGYYICALSKDSKVNWFSVHKLTALHFIKNPNNLPILNHKDKNKLNNFYKNIEWCTSEDNSKHYYSSGFHPYLFSKTNQPSNKKVNFSTVEITSKIIIENV